MHKNSLFSVSSSIPHYNTLWAKVKWKAGQKKL